MAETYTVKKGDTLNKIAGQYGFKNYKEAGISGYRSGNADLIYAGEKLTIGNYKPPAAANAGTATDIINSGQDADIARGDDTPTRNNNEDDSRSSRYSTAFSEVGELFDMGDRPDAPNFEDTYEDLRRDLNVDDLENYVTDLQAEEEEIFAQLRQRRTAERGKTVATNVIEGRISQTERQESERLDYIRRAKQTAVNQLQAANATIENLINFKKLDYDTARNEYNDQFSQQMSIFNTVKGVVDSEISDEQRAEDTARANLNIIYGAITEGTIDGGSIDPEMQYTINKMELSAGLPTGFYENLRNQNPDGKILSTTTRTANGGKYADIILQNPDGGFTTKSVYLGAADTKDGNGDDDGDGIPDVEYTWEEYLNAAQEELGMTINPSNSLYTELKDQYSKDFQVRPAVKFTSTEIKKLEQAGLLYAPRQEQLDFLYKGEEEAPDPIKDPEGYAAYMENKY